MSEARGLTPDEARQLTDKIKKGLTDTWELIKEAYKKRADRVLGYGSWDSYCRAEFGSSYLRVPPEDRAEIIRSLRQAYGCAADRVGDGCQRDDSMAGSAAGRRESRPGGEGCSK